MLNYFFDLRPHVCIIFVLLLILQVSPRQLSIFFHRQAYFACEWVDSWSNTLRQLCWVFSWVAALHLSWCKKRFPFVSLPLSSRSALALVFFWTQTNSIEFNEDFFSTPSKAFAQWSCLTVNLVSSSFFRRKWSSQSQISREYFTGC